MSGKCDFLLMKDSYCADLMKYLVTFIDCLAKIPFMVCLLLDVNSVRM